MKKPTRRVLQIFAVIVVIGAAIGARTIVLRRPAPENETIVPPVRTVRPEMRMLEEVLRAYGPAESDNLVSVLPRVGGTVEELPRDVGDVVAEGDLLAVIDGEAYALDLQRAEAAYAAVFSTWERVDRLHQNGNATRQVWEEAKAAYETTRAQRDQARLRMDWSRVTSPTEGVVLVRHVARGSLVSPEAGIPLITVGSLSDLVVAVDLPESRFPVLTSGAVTVRARPEAFRRQELEARVRSVAPWVDPRTRTFAVTAEVVGDPGGLRPGMLVELEFVLAVLEGEWSLPQEALTGGRTLWIVDAEGRARIATRDADTYPKLGGRIVLPDNLAGEEFILEGQHFLREGQEVKVIDGGPGENA